MSRPDQDSRTEKPSTRWLKRLERDGEVTRSTETMSALLLVATVVWLAMAGGSVIADLTGLFAIDTTQAADEFRARLGKALVVATHAFLAAVLPLLGLVVAIAVSVGLAQTRGVLNVKAVIPKLDRIHPMNGVRRLFSRRTGFEGVKAVAKIVIVCSATWFVASHSLDAMVGAFRCGLACFLPVLGAVLLDLSIKVLPALAGLAALDFVFQHIERLRQSRMTKDEARRDKKERLGDPLLRRRRKAALKRVQASGSVASATVVVVSQTTGVALRYVAGDTPLPVVLAVARGDAAETMIERALAEGIVVVEDNDLADRIGRASEAGDYIRADAVKRTAAIISRVLKR